MNVDSIGIEESPEGADRVRLSAVITYDAKDVERECYWFDVPRARGDSLTDSGNPWLACLLPLAMTRHEPLRITAPVDPLLLRNAHELMRIWSRWYPGLPMVALEIPVLEQPPRTGRPAKTAAFFSGGVDSYFTVLRHQCPNTPGRIAIEDLLWVWGFDVSLPNVEASRRLCGVLRQAASELGKPLTDVTTNLRTTQWRFANWGLLSHGAGLASVALALERAYHEVLIPSTLPYEALVPWGAHPLTDPLFSTAATRIIHDGAGFDRVEKTEVVAGSPEAMRSLHVCWELKTDENCQACAKCYHTMTTLLLLGALDRCATFDGARLDVSRLARMYAFDEGARFEVRQLRALARRARRNDVAWALSRSLWYSRRVHLYLRLARRLGKMRLLWRWADALERWVRHRTLM